MKKISLSLWAIPLALKSDTFGKFKDWLASVELQTGSKVLEVWSDNGGEFLSGDFVKFLGDRGIARQLSIPDTPQQKGVAERVNRSITKGLRTMLHSSGLPLYMWAQALATYVHVKNRSPHSAINGGIPHFWFFGVKPSVIHLRAFGCRAYKAATTETRSKLEPRGIPLIFVGYDAMSKAYRLFDPRTRLLY